MLFVVVLVGLLSACHLWSNASSDESEPEESEPERSEEASDQPRQRATIDWGPPLEVADGDGYRGPWQMNESQFFYVDDPSVDIGADGTTAVVWVDNRDQNVFLSLYDEDGGEGLDEATNISGSPGVFSWLPRVVMAGEAEIYVLWQEILFTGGSHGGEILFARSTDGGQSFSEPLNLSNTEAGAGKGRMTRQRWHNGSLDLAVGAGGEIVSAWTEYEGALRVSRSTDGGQSFSEPLHVAGSEDEPARGPDLAVGPEGEIYLAWALGEDGSADIELALSDDGGQTFEELGAIVDTEGHSDAPALAVDGQGVVHVIYAESPNGLFDRYHLRYLRSDGAGGAFEDLGRLAPAEEGGRGGAHFPSVAIGEDGSGQERLVVAWEQYEDFRQRPQGMGVALSAALSGDEIGEFSEPEMPAALADELPGASGGLQGLFMRKIAIGPRGQVGLVHSFFDEGRASGVRLLPGRLESDRVVGQER